MKNDFIESTNKSIELQNLGSLEKAYTIADTLFENYSCGCVGYCGCVSRMVF